MTALKQRISGQSMIEKKFSEMGINLDHEAARVLTSSARAVRAILERRTGLDQAGRYNVPLIVLAGEIHNNPAHIIHHMAVLKEISRIEKIVLCSEVSHSLLEEYFKYFQGQGPSKEAGAALKKLDLAGVLSLETSIGFTHMVDAPYANKILESFVLDQAIPTRFVDVAQKSMIIDFNDASTRASIRSCFNALSNFSGIHVENVMGMKIRNHHMLGRTMEHVQNHAARIAFLTCGGVHVCGHTREGYPENESLSFMAKEKAAVLAMPIIRENMPAPFVRELTGEELLSIKELSQVVTNYNAETDELWKEKCSGIVLENTAEEAAYVNGLLERTGFQDRVLSVAQYEELMNRKEQKVLQDFKAFDVVRSLAL